MEQLLTTLAPLLGLVTMGGLAGVVIAFRRFPKERDQLIVAAAQDVVGMQSGVIARYDARFTELEARVDKAEEAREAAETALHDTIGLYQTEQERNRQLSARVEALEAEVAELRRASTPPSRRGKAT